MAKKIEKQKPWIGWHFLPEDGRTRYSHQPVRVGGVLKIDGPLVICDRGLHASARALDALKYAPGLIVCLVELRGERIDDSDKSCAMQRKCLAKIDATKTLHLFACWCARRALLAERHAGREPDKRSWDAIRVKRRWLSGRASDAELSAAGRAAGLAAAARWSAAWVTAEGVAAARWAARWAAAAARWAAAEAAGAAGKAAAEEEEEEKAAQNRQLEKMLRAAIRKAKGA